MKKGDTEFARFKRAMAKMEAEKKKDEIRLKEFKMQKKAGEKPVKDSA